ncbi:E3 SUMO-protein ligase ZBED1-like [Alosa pseudoharengus]|uniref:E3 SUMO-protein ligase ZBED1-like n=1 Tax=Alosa pseudoharengus TaxID=34774 RepID=UPI003F89046B
MAASREKLVPKKGTVSSVIWNWFAFVRSDLDQTTPRYKVCMKSVASKGSSTTNLLQHLKQKNPVEWEKCCSQRNEKDSSTPSTTRTAAKIQSTVPQTFSNCIPYDKNSTRWKAITDAVAMYIAKDMVPIYTVEKPGFINMIKVLDPRYVLPSRKFFSDVALPNLYNSTRQRVTKELEDVSFYSATTDLWSSRTMQPYMSLTVHFINNDWTLRSVCLQTAYFPEDHTGEIVAQGLKEMPSTHGTLPKTDSFEKALVCVLGSDKKSRHLVPPWQDLDVLESINKAVKPLQEFTDALSGESYVSVSYIKPVLHLFKTSLLEPGEEDTELTKTIKGNIMRYLDDKYSDPVKDELLDMASLVDPRFRTTYIDPDKVEEVKKRDVAELMALPAPANNSTPQQPGTAVQVRQEDAQPPPKKKMTLAAFFKQNVVSSPNQSEAEKIETELKSYLLTLEIDPDTNPLEWWKRHQPNFPRLSVLAKRYLSIPATKHLAYRKFYCTSLFNVVTATTVIGHRS